MATRLTPDQFTRSAGVRTEPLRSEGDKPADPLRSEGDKPADPRVFGPEYGPYGFRLWDEHSWIQVDD